MISEFVKYTRIVNENGERTTERIRSREHSDITWPCNLALTIDIKVDPTSIHKCLTENGSLYKHFVKKHLRESGDRETRGIDFLH